MDPSYQYIPNKNNILNQGIFRPDGYTILFQLILAFVLGIVFAPFRGGLLFVIATALLFELLFAASINFKYGTKVSVFRFSLFAAAFLGFIIGRAVLGDDKIHRSFYKDRTSCYKLCKTCASDKKERLREKWEKIIDEHKIET